MITAATMPITISVFLAVIMMPSTLPSRRQHRTLDARAARNPPEDALGGSGVGGGSLPLLHGVALVSSEARSASPPNHWEHPPPAPNGHRCPRRSAISNSWQTR